MTVKRTEPAVVTGKPVSLGGSWGRREATGRGVMTVTLAAMDETGHAPIRLQRGCSGFGNVGPLLLSCLHSKAVRSWLFQMCLVGITTNVAWTSSYDRVLKEQWLQLGRVSQGGTHLQ